MEVTAGARTTRAADSLRQLMLRGGPVPFDAQSDFDAAALIYRRCREADSTPRGMIDCLIAAVAWRAGASLLCRNVDLDRIARLIGVPLDTPSKT